VLIDARLARGMKPDIGKSLSIFIALAPAVYAGPLTTGFPFNLIKSLDWKTWKRLFGVLDFIPIVSVESWTEQSIDA
jgi:lysosomal acid lipase/cholesteryl ester hydrolase